jgi:thiol-disulfide isomerase/thioredoxin
MRNILFLIFVQVSFLSFAQHQIKGTIEPFDKEIKWAMLYQIKDGRQHYIENSKIDNKSFYFKIPSTASSGMYRIVYRLKGESFIDVLYNKEDVTFKFNPDYPEETVVYSESRENTLYQEYLQNILGVQQYLDSIQISYFKTPKLITANLYQEAYYELRDLQKKYETESKNMLVFNFIKATHRYNSSLIVSIPNIYLKNTQVNFFNNIDFQDGVLVNSSFLIDRTIDYIFNLNYSNDPKTQQNLFKESINKVLSIPKKTSLQKDLIQIIIQEFVNNEDSEMVEYLLENYYKDLPKEEQSSSYIEETLAKISIFIGAVAPDFAWGENKKLSTLNTHKNYIVLFWSTSCSHCKSQLPKIDTFLDNFKNIQVIAIALEKDEIEFEKQIVSFPEWEHVLGIGKWKNTIARSYSIEATPTFLLLNSAKEIIALPDSYEDLTKAIYELQ